MALAIIVFPHPGGPYNRIPESRRPYRKPPNISPGLIFVHMLFLVGLYMGAYIQGGVVIYGQDFVLVILTIY